MLTFAIAESTQGLLTDTMALAAIALIGYLCGQRTRQKMQQNNDEKLIFELSRAALVAKELQQVAQRIRQEVSSHQSQISKFQARLQHLQSHESLEGWQQLSDEAESLLVPTMKLTTKLSLAYDQLRKQSSQLMNFAESRTDPLTGVCNRRAMEEQLEVLFSLHAQNDSRFSLALFSMKGHAEESADSDSVSEANTEQIRTFADLLKCGSRDTDIVARCSSDEFTVLMPHTSLAGAAVYSERLIRRLDEELGTVVSGGIVEVQSNDNPQKILSRADSALYSARTNDFSSLYLHNGKAIRAHEGLGKDSQEAAIHETTQADSHQAEPEPASAGV